MTAGERDRDTSNDLPDGVDILPDLMRDQGPALAAMVGLPEAILQRLGAIPSSYLLYYEQAAGADPQPQQPIAGGVATSPAIPVK